MKDVTKYVQTIAKRLGTAFSLESFGVEDEIEFWVQAADYLSREETPSFKDVVEWMDILYDAPVHFVYLKEGSGKLKLQHRKVLSHNLKTKLSLKQLSKSDRKEKVSQFEQRLDNLELQIPITSDLKEKGVSSFPIGNCYRIPLIHDDEFQGIYCTGPYVESPEVIIPRLSIIGRILSRWMLELHQAEEDARDLVQEKLEKKIGILTADSFKVRGHLKVMLRHLTNVKKARFAALVELEEDPLVLAQANLDKEFINTVLDFEPSENDSTDFKSHLKTQLDLAEKQSLVLERFDTENKRTVLLMGLAEADKKALLNSDTYPTILNTLEEMLKHRDQRHQLSDQIIDTYYRMLRELEQQWDRTKYHTDRVMALSSTFADYHGLSSEDKQHILLTAKLHDIGYLGVHQFKDYRTVGGDLEHPLLGERLVNNLPIDDDVKQGIRTHHEWVDGSGTPNGIKGDDIPITGKVVGLFEYITAYIESPNDGGSQSPEEKLQELVSSLLERAEVQFDMELVSTVVEMMNDIGWEQICEIGQDQ